MPALFDINAWSFRAAVLGFFLAIIACATPQWFYVFTAISFGLRATCEGSACYAINFQQLHASLSACGGCAGEPADQFRLRWRSIEAFGWIYVVLALTMCVGLFLILTHPVRPKAAGAALICVGVVTILVGAAALGIFYGSVSCGIDCLQFGGSAYALAASCLLSLVGLVVGALASRRDVVARQPFGVTAVFFSAGAAALGVGALVTNTWVIFGTKPANYGLWLNCDGLACSILDVKRLLTALRPGVGCQTTDTDGDASAALIQFWVGGGLLGLTAPLLVMLAYYSSIPLPQPSDDEGSSAGNGVEDATNRNAADDSNRDDGSRATRTTEPTTGAGDEQRKIQQTHLQDQPDHDDELLQQQRQQQPEEEEESPAARLGLLIVILVLVTAANVIILYRFEAGLFCGKSFCQAVFSGPNGLGSVSSSTTVKSRSLCEYGVASICALVLNVLLFAQLLAEIVHRCRAGCESSMLLSAEEAAQQDAELARLVGSLGVVTDDDDDDQARRPQQRVVLIVDGKPSPTAEATAEATTTTTHQTRRWRNEWMSDAWTRSACFSLKAWALLVLVLGAMCCAGFALVSPKWSVDDIKLEFYGVFEKCVGDSAASCSSYSNGNCEGGQPGTERSRHMLIGVAAGVGVLFGIAALPLVFVDENDHAQEKKNNNNTDNNNERNSRYRNVNDNNNNSNHPPSTSIVAGRAGLFFMAALCTGMGVIMWSASMYSCSGSNACPGCTFGAAFWMAASAAGALLVAFMWALVDALIVFCSFSSSSSSSSSLENASGVAATAAAADGENSDNNELQNQQEQNQPEQIQSREQQRAGEGDDAFDENSDPAQIGLDPTFAFIVESGLWFSADHNLYFNYETQLYGDPDTGEWLTGEEDSQQQEQQQQSEEE